MKIALLLLLAMAGTHCAAQKHSDIPATADSIAAWLYATHEGDSQAESYDWDREDSLHRKITLALADILSDKRIFNYDLDSLLTHEWMTINHSPDKQLWIFTWPENLYGEFSAYRSVVHYRTGRNIPGAFYELPEHREDTSRLVFCPQMAQNEHYEMHKLTNSDKNLYLIMTGGYHRYITHNIATVVEITPDSINLQYPAFPAGKHIVNNGSCFYLSTRWPASQSFAFDTATQVLTIEYTPDHINFELPRHWWEQLKHIIMKYQL